MAKGTAKGTYNEKSGGGTKGARVARGKGGPMTTTSKAKTSYTKGSGGTKGAKVNRGS